MKSNRNFVLGILSGAAATIVLASAMLFTSGFQDPANKIGIVDINKVFEKSVFGEKSKAQLTAMMKAREDVIVFVQTYRVLTVEQAQKFRELSLKNPMSQPEKAELEKIKADIMEADKKAKDLMQKANLTPEERTAMDEYARRAQNMEVTTQRWTRDFNNEMQVWVEKNKTESLDKTRAAIQEVAKAAGYTVVLEVGVAPYGANDLTEAALKAMNAKP